MTSSKIRLHISGQSAIAGGEKRVFEDMTQQWACLDGSRGFPVQTIYGSVQRGTLCGFVAVG